MPTNGSALAARLVEPIDTLADFQNVATDAVAFLSAGTRGSCVARTAGRGCYELWNFTYGGRKIQTRPVNTSLYVSDAAEFEVSCTAVRALMTDLKASRGPTPAVLKKHKTTIDGGGIQRVFYTLQQSYGMACDILLPENTAKKHVGLKFEALIGEAFGALGIAHKHLVFKVPGGEGERPYQAEIDYIIGPDANIVSSGSLHDPREVIVSVKSSSKDRMPKIFIDRLLMERISEHPVKLIGVFHNDIQRKGENEVSGTFVANLFLIYSKYLRPLNGVYFVDPPPHIEKAAWKPYIKKFQDLVVTDVWELLKPTE